MSIAEDVRLYIKNKPYVKECLEKGIVNLSSLTRQIQNELDIKNFEAVKAALRRLSEDMKKIKYRREEKVLQILKKSKITVYEGYSVIISDRPLNKQSKIKIELPDCTIYLTDKEYASNIKENILKKNIDCTVILIKSPKEIEDVPGVVAYITSVLAEQNINVLEFISAWVYTTIVVDKKDSLKVYEILNSILG